MWFVQAVTQTSINGARCCLTTLIWGFIEGRLYTQIICTTKPTNCVNIRNKVHIMNARVLEYTDIHKRKDFCSV
jgi:hypothetical protein